jgi:hypothetical protein
MHLLCTAAIFKIYSPMAYMTQLMNWGSSLPFWRWSPQVSFASQ